MKLTKQCYGCKESFRKTELVDYASPRSNTMQSYCPKCLAEKQARDRFSDKVCELFGIKSPGPRLWTERKRLQEKYGYTDDTIVSCLDFLYNVEHMKKLTESLALVTPTNIDRMLKWKRKQQYEAAKLATSMSSMAQVENRYVELKETKTKKKELNPDDWID